MDITSTLQLIAFRDDSKRWTIIILMRTHSALLGRWEERREEEREEEERRWKKKYESTGDEIESQASVIRNFCSMIGIFGKKIRLPGVGTVHEKKHIHSFISGIVDLREASLNWMKIHYDKNIHVLVDYEEWN